MSESLRDKVAIVGAGCCQFGENWDKSREDMIVDACYEAYADAGIESPQDEIDAIFAGAVYPRDGSAEIAEALKIFGKPISVVSDYCQTGTDAFRFGVFAIAAGVYDKVLVVGFDKPKDRGVSGPSVSFDKVRGLPATPAGWFSLCAARYFETYGAGREDLAKIAVKNHHNGTLAPKSMLKKEITVEDVLKARIISWPFGLFDCAAQSDGASAVILTRADLAKQVRDDHVLVKAVTVACSEHPQRDPNFDFLGWKPTQIAAQDAYAMAGISDPFKEIDVVQLHDCFTLTEMLSYEDLGLCEKGSAKDHVASGTFELGGELPVNTDGGLKTFGHPTGATGIRMIYENVKQLQGKAEQRQIKNATTALSHNIGGPPTTCGIAILGMP
ncbi:MAG: acetyl-CoA acetyltransferase [Candidatus Binatia bacterium]|nr:acetyl-CoA acetyltransferase [Candidatus Binatia bacterium]MDG2008930.1 acetyl-CoA acetyltransferase [Candidatus Binatia bacterium]